MISTKAKFAIIAVKTLNEVYSSLSTRRRYEVWFLRLGLADGSGAWWFRYLLMNPGRGGCAEDPRGMPVQVWATWFPAEGKPQSFIQGFALNDLELSGCGQNPFRLRIGENEIGQNSCRGALQLDGHAVAWELEYGSTFRVTLSNKGWIGFSRTPHSNARFSGKITLDGQTFGGSPLGFGLQGHNCGYRHRGFWTWAHVYFPRPDGSSSTLEALVYDMPLGMIFRKAVLWHEGRRQVFRDLRDIRNDARTFRWNFRCGKEQGLQVEVALDGSGPGIHRLPYVKTDCSGSFEVTNNSLAGAVVKLTQGERVERLETASGAVLEMVGS
ncbi:MAG TPA: hypothetical protein VLV49_18335 [Terriglobales bacterium]|nr:hypothetical protein [Terriglobales bacterium]